MLLHDGHQILSIFNPCSVSFPSVHADVVSLAQSAAEQHIYLEAQQGSACPRAAAILQPHTRLTVLTTAGHRRLGQAQISKCIAVPRQRAALVQLLPLRHVVLPHLRACA